VFSVSSPWWWGSVPLCCRDSEESLWAKGGTGLQRRLHVQFSEINPVSQHPVGASAKGIKGGKRGEHCML